MNKRNTGDPVQQTAKIILLHDATPDESIEILNRTAVSRMTSNRQAPLTSSKTTRLSTYQ